ncbi:MAG: orotidine-5'-phosphate decarboxylase [candidate division Zixibacteria bacterium]|nr:orotidine-5'-phosphate decarboxylase [candidate division Zixibacteria bacterium]
MSAVKKLLNAQDKNKSMMCLGLDLDPKRMPPDYAKSIKGMYEFAHRIIEATADSVCAYKPNIAFYESCGPDGLSLLRHLVERIPDDIPVIIDGKRGDIGNTASHYAHSLFDRLRADWVTLNPYMGYDSMRPFLEYEGKGVFVLCLTSNSGAKDFQLLNVEGRPLYRIVAEKVAYWNKDNNCGLVVGATQPEQLREIREVAGNMPLLIPGVGAQGGSLEKAAEYGTANFQRPALINVSRSILYASRDQDFAARARAELKKLNQAVASVRAGLLASDAAESRQPQPEQPESQIADDDDRLEQPQQRPNNGPSERPGENDRDFRQNYDRDNHRRDRYNGDSNRRS